MRVILLYGLQLCFLLLLPVIIRQGKRVKENTVRLPEAKGERTFGQQQELSLLHIGESTVVGVGLKTFPMA